MRILFIAPFGLRHKTTVWARTLPLARHLAHKGHHVTLLIPPWDSPEDAGTAWLDEGVQVRHTSPATPLPCAIFALLRAATLERADIVHIVKPRAYAGMAQWAFWQRSRLSSQPPRIVLDMDDWEQAWAPVNKYPPLTARFLAWQEEWGIRHAHAITTASRWLEQKAHDYTHNTPVLYLPNGIALPTDPPQEDAISVVAPSQPTVLYFSRFVEVAPHWLAEFADALFAARPDVRLLVAGSPLHAGGDLPFRDTFTMRIHTEAGRVHWLGTIPPQALPSLYAASTCAIFPATPEPLQLAKCSVRLATSLLAGVPVVASDVGEQASYGANGAAALLPAGTSPQEFAHAVIALLDDAPARAHMVERARAHLAAVYQWATLGDILENFYEGLLRRSNQVQEQEG